MRVQGGEGDAGGCSQPSQQQPRQTTHVDISSATSISDTFHTATIALFFVDVIFTKYIYGPDMIFVNNFTRQEFLRPNFTSKRVNWNNGTFATKQV